MNTPAELAEAIAAAERIYIVGPPGSGKSTLARRIAEPTGLPVHDLDRVYRVAGGNTALRAEPERDELVTRILASGRWIAEGVHLGWTDRLMDAAEVIVWLDHLSWPRLAARMTRRFAGGATSEARRQRGGRRFLRVSDYRRHLIELIGTLRDARAYGRVPGDGPRGTPGRRATLRQLAAQRDRVIHVRRAADEEEVVTLVSRGDPTTGRPGRDQATHPAG